MNLRTAALLLLIGLSYIGLHKVAIGLAPGLQNPGLLDVAFSSLWFLSALTIVLFAYQFLVEVRPRHAGLRYSVSAILIFTGIVIVSKLPLPLGPETWATQRLIFDVSRALNSVAVLAALISLLRLVPDGSRLRTPLRWSVFGCGLSTVFRLVSTGLFLKFFVTGEEAEAWALAPILSAGVAFFAFGTIAWFLVFFRQVEDYSLFGGNGRSFAA